MDTTTIPAVVLLAVLVTTAAIGATAAAQTGDAEGSELGAEVSAFVHSSAADARDAVVDGMADAAYRSAPPAERPAVVENHSDRLAERLDELRDERAALAEENNSSTAREARLAAIATRISNVERALNTTEERAIETGVDTEALAELRANASELSGEEVAEIARGLAGVDTPPGPPESADDREATPDRAGPPEDRGGAAG